MNYTCPKCGKKMELSTEVLINSEYKVICPQCLSELQIVGDYAYIPHQSLDLDTSVEPSRTICCPTCGHEASTNAHFCPNCGASFDAGTPKPAAVDVAAEEVTVLPPPLPDSDPLYQDAVQFLMTCCVTISRSVTNVPPSSSANSKPAEPSVPIITAVRARFSSLTAACSAIRFLTATLYLPDPSHAG